MLLYARCIMPEMRILIFDTRYAWILIAFFTYNISINIYEFYTRVWPQCTRVYICPYLYRNGLFCRFLREVVKSHSSLYVCVKPRVIAMHMDVNFSALVWKYVIRCSGLKMPILRLVLRAWKHFTFQRSQGGGPRIISLERTILSRPQNVASMRSQLDA